MSLNADDSRRRGRSRSTGRRDDYDDREVSRTRVSETRERVSVGRAPSPPSSRYDDRDSYEYEETRTSTIRNDRDRDRGRDSEDEEPRYSKKYRADSPGSRPKYSMPGGFRGEEDVEIQTGSSRRTSYYEDRKYSKREESSSPPTKSRYSKEESYQYTGSDRRDRDKDRDYRRYQEDSTERERGSFSVSAGKHSISGGVSVTHGERRDRSTSPPSSPPYSSDHRSSTVITSAGRSSYAEPKEWQYAKPEETVTYSSTRKESYSSRPPYSSGPGSQSQIVTVEPGARRGTNTASLGARMGSLSVSGTAGAPMSLSAAPGSPLLESYHGTYQSIGNMPSPLMITSGSHSSVEKLDIAPLSLVGSKRRHARFHDPRADAAALALALKGSKSPDVAPLIEILPALTQGQILELRVEYKKLVKTGSERKGVNIAKHIKLRLKEEDPALMKACYTVALGQWESEAYWANSYYQGEKSRRELLIESLMGRTNAEIRAIKDGFSDKKYSDSLVRCMKTELKEDKFKKAILLVLEERRMEERPGYQLDRRLVEDDVRELHKAIRSEKGGETSMINIIVLRSDSHIREVLRVYEVSFRENFARAMLKKSGNLVGELLAHILNGVINRPVRDALLLHHALTLTKSDGLRKQLLTSRLVRYHWNRPHMEAIKREYRARYSKDLQQAVADGTSREWGEFMEELCVRRMADDVRRVERVEMVDTISVRR